MSQQRLRRSSRRSIGLSFASIILTSRGCNPALCWARVAGALRRVHEDCVPSVEVAIEKLVQAVTCIVRCLAVVFQPVTKDGPAGLKLRVIETVVRAGIHNKLDWRPVVAPGGDFVGTVCRRRPIVEGSDKDERGYPRTRPCLLTWR